MANIAGEVSIEIAAPAEAIYDYVLDLARHSEWNYQPGPVVKTSSGPPRLGATYHAYERWPDGALPMKLMMMAVYAPFMLIYGAKMETEATVTVADRPNRIAWDAHAPKRRGDMMRARWGLAFSPAPSGTRVTQSYEFIPQMRFPGAPPRSMVEGEVGRNLALLKKRMEERQGAAVSELPSS